MIGAWLVMALPPEERTYRGNVGYEDDVTKLYRFDSKVQNSAQVLAGDLLVQRSSKNMIGVARVARVISAPGTKELLRCPNCGKTGFKARQTVTPAYRCSACRTEFDDPVRTTETVTKFEAHLEDFVATPGALTIDELRKACPNYAGQLAIQRLDVDKIAGKLAQVAPSSASLLEYPVVLAAVDTEGAFDPDGITDAREKVLRAIAARQGAPEFRRQLLRNYGARCVVTGCDVEATLEAAHIVPYKGKETDHETNGLLLRADIHTLFDRGLLSIDPKNLTVVVHDSLLASQYGELQGRPLKVPAGATRPSGKALAHHLASSRLHAC